MPGAKPGASIRPHPEGVRLTLLNYFMILPFFTLADAVRPTKIRAFA
jgi:hypothetical protein